MERVLLSTFETWEVDRKASYVMGLIMDPEVYEVSITVDGDDWYITSNNAFCMNDAKNYTVPEFVIDAIHGCESISIRSITTYDYLRCERADLISKIALGKIESLIWQCKRPYTRYEFSYLSNEYWEDLSDDAEPQTTVSMYEIIEKLYKLPVEIHVTSEVRKDENVSSEESKN